MLLTCPTCRSGLEVPEGTTARVRCPSCQTIFAAADGIAPPPLPPAPAPAPPSSRPSHPKPPPRAVPAAAGSSKSRPRHDRGDGDKKPAQYAEYDDDKRPRKRKRSRDRDQSLSPEEKKVLRAAFDRAMWGARLIWISLLFYVGGMFMICCFYIHASVMYSYTGGVYAPNEFFVVAGILGMCNWLLAAVGIGLCMAGPRSPGHFLYTICAVVAMVVHAIFMIALVARVEPDRRGEEPVVEAAVKWRQVPTRLDSVTLYMTLIVYPDEFPAESRRVLVLGVVTGIAEMIRLMFLMMALSCLARAAGDDELSGKCTRASAFVALAPGVMALLSLGLTAFIIETNADETVMGRILLSVMLSGISAMLAGALIPPLTVSRETAEACEFPYEKELDVFA